MLPPDDCMMRNPWPRAFSRPSRYLCMTWPTYELTTTVLVRSYSRNSGSTRLEMEMKGLLGRVRRASRTASSWAGFRKENRKDTATPSTLASFSSPTSVWMASGDRSSTMVPSWSTRSGSPKRSSQGARAGGRSNSRLYSSALFWRPISKTSSNPRVVTKAVRPPLPSSRALVATVEP